MKHCNKDMKVINSRYASKQGLVFKRRRRECSCGHRVTTYEVSEDVFKRLSEIEEIACKIKSKLAEVSRIMREL